MREGTCCVRARPWLAACLVLALAGLFAAGIVVGQVKTAPPADNGAAAAPAAGIQAEAAPSRPRNPEAAAQGTTFAKQLSEAFHNAAQKVLPSVVTIVNSPPASAQPAKRPSADEDEDDEDQNPFEGTPFGDLFHNNPDFRHFFKGPATGRSTTTGSGVIIDSSGVILTNNHVIEGEGRITVRLPDGREFQGKEIKTDPKTDLAIVRIHDAGKLTAAPLGDSNALEVGDWVLALGQPFGLEGTVTAGIISAKGRGLGLNVRESFLQTDAAINPAIAAAPWSTSTAK